MKPLLLLVSILTFTLSFGQKWLHDGAEWHYSSTGEAQSLFHHLTYDKDTVILGEDWQQVHHTSYWYLPTSPDTDTLLPYGSEFHYFRMTGDTVFRLIDKDTLFEDVAFIFADQATWVSNENSMNEHCDHDLLYKSKSFIYTFQGQSIDSYSISFKSAAISDSIQTGSYSSRFGCIYGSLFPTGECNAQGFYWGATFNLICYQDNDGFFIKRTTGDCDYYMTLNTHNTTLTNISIYPNPAHDKIFIQSESKIDHVECYDLFGKLMPITYDVISQKVTFNHISSGVYLLKMESAGSFRMERIVIE